MSDTVTEYAVLDKTKGQIVGFGRFARQESVEGAKEYIAWLEKTREELQAKAEANEASDFEGGNEDWWVFNREGWKDAEWIPVTREVTPWRPV